MPRLDNGPAIRDRRGVTRVMSRVGRTGRGGRPPGARPGHDPKGATVLPYRVLDLTDERGQLCGRLLADLGADVILVEPPGGSSSRRVGPFVGDVERPGGEPLPLVVQPGQALGRARPRRRRRPRASCSTLVARRRRPGGVLRPRPAGRPRPRARACWRPPTRRSCTSRSRRSAATGRRPAGPPPT